MINQGDLYWVDFGEPRGASPGYRHPCVVIQNDLYNQSRLRTVIVCVLTSNLQRADAPGNVLLAQGEGKLTKASVVLVSQLYTVDKLDLETYIGSLSNSRIREIVAGLHLVFDPLDMGFATANWEDE